MTTSDYNEIVQRMVEAAGHATQSLGVGRVIGQIYAYLYFSPSRKSLNEITKALGISKGSTSIGVRQLEQWEALDKVWVKGDRKDYYEARDNFGRIIKNAIKDLAGKRMERSSVLLDNVEAELASTSETSKALTSDEQFVRDRIERMRTFQKKAEGLWDGVLLTMLLK